VCLLFKHSRCRDDGGLEGFKVAARAATAAAVPLQKGSMINDCRRQQGQEKRQEEQGKRTTKKHESKESKQQETAHTQAFSLGRFSFLLFSCSVPFHFHHDNHMRSPLFFSEQTTTTHPPLHPCTMPQACQPNETTHTHAHKRRPPAGAWTA
jgi:hypothetical protein